MSASTPTSDQFWLLAGEVPTGPFTVAQVHAELAAGQTTWQTPACQVGGTTWLPLLKTPGIGPAADEPPLPATGDAVGGTPDPSALLHTASVSVTPSPTPPLADRLAATPTGNPPARQVAPVIEVVILATLLGLLGAAGYGLYEWYRPLTPTEVCRRLERATTAAEAKKYATLRMHPLLDALFADQSALDPSDTFEWTSETDGPRPGTRLVGFRGTTYMPGAGRRARVEGHIITVKADRWKADDYVITGVEGSIMPGPVSLVHEYRRPPGSTVGGFARATPPTEGRSPTETPRANRGHVQLFDWARDKIGWGGIVTVGVVVCLVLTARDGARKKPRAS